LGLLLLGMLLVGCTAPSRRLPEAVSRDAQPTLENAPAQPAETIRQTGFTAAASDEPPPALPAPTPVAPESPPDSPFAETKELSADALVQQVLVRNPSLAQMTAAWKAAQARYPQVTSLDDPMFGTTLAPAALTTLPDSSSGYRFEVSQKYPWFGKRQLRGANALAEANAAGDEVEDMRLQLVESARLAFFEYYLVHRALAVNRAGLRKVRDFREEAESRYRQTLSPQQDIFQADVEIGKQQERLVTLQRMREVAIARINTLMHLPPDSPLPPPPAELPAPVEMPDTTLLRSTALARRPDLKVLSDRIAADQANLALAKKEFAPDIEVMAAYDSFWSNPQQRAQIGLKLNLPARLQRRYGAIAEAQARLAGRKAELARQADQVNLQVQEAAAQVRESARLVRLNRQTILRAADNNVEAARSAYGNGRVPFISLIEAQRNAINLRDRYYEAVADYGRRLATLERVIGGPLDPSPPSDGSVPCRPG
jgi:outer membrane protein TolC